MKYCLEPGDTRRTLVLMLQASLVGGNFGKPELITGSYDDGTMKAVTKLQMRFHAPTTGRWDQSTQDEVKAKTGFDLVKWHDACYPVSAETLTLEFVKTSNAARADLGDAAATPAPVAATLTVAQELAQPGAARGK